MRGRLRFWWLAFLLLAGCGEYEEREKEVGYKGLARVNRFLAAERFASEMGLKASSYAGAPSLPPSPQATVVLPAESLLNVGDLDVMSDWIDEGGHLITYLAVDRKQGMSLTGWSEEPAFQAFLDYFELGFEKLENETWEKKDRAEDDESEWFAFGGRHFDEVELWNGRVYETDFNSRYLLFDTELQGVDERVIQTYEYGLGHLTVLSSAELFTNRFIGKEEHATLLWDVLSLGEGKEVWFVHSTRLSFFKLLWMRAPHAVITLIVVIILLVWWASRGFGPKFIRGTNPSANLDGHLEASGAFFRKHGAEMEVLGYLRGKLLRTIARATNQPFNLGAEELVAAGQKQGVLNLSEAKALTEVPNRKTLLLILQTLQKLEERL